jgi:hypothetical protein
MVGFMWLLTLTGDRRNGCNGTSRKGVVMGRFMSDPGQVFWLMLRATHGVTAERRRWFDYGRIAVALEMVSAMKVIESLPVEDERVREAVVSALQTLLTEIGLIDSVDDLYEQLAVWRMPRFVPDGEFPLPSLLGTYAVDVPSPPDRPFGLSSPDEAPAEEMPPPTRLDERD